MLLFGPVRRVRVFEERPYIWKHADIEKQPRLEA